MSSLRSIDTAYLNWYNLSTVLKLNPENTGKDLLIESDLQHRVIRITTEKMTQPLVRRTSSTL